MKKKAHKLTTAQINKINRDNNAIFKAASLRERRILIAQDVIDRINANQFRGVYGLWAVIENIDNHNSKASVQGIINKGTVCECCALGGLLLSCTALKNRITVEDVESEAFNGSYLLETGFGTIDKTGLKKLFGVDQLKKIEYCFEAGGGATDIDEFTFYTQKRVDAFATSILKNTPTSRLRIIMENIVKNNGTFKV